MSTFSRSIFAQLISVLGAAVVVLAVGVSPASAVYAGSNGRVVYTLYNDSETSSDIYSVAANGTGTRRLTRDGHSSHPRWNYGGGLIAFQRGTTTRGIFTGDLYVMRADGSGVHRVTSGADAQEPVWSPKSDQLMFVRRVNGHTDLFRVPAAGGALTRVTYAAGAGCDADHPDWRGTLVVYHRHCASSDEIRLLDLSSGVNRLVVSGDPAANESVSWPDFTSDLRIMFMACLQSDPVCYATQNVHVINQDGTGMQVLTDSSGCCGEPEYSTPVPSPDGTTYLVASGYGNEEQAPPDWELGGPGNPPDPLLHSGHTPAVEPDWQRTR
jgi:Tol biopolymer transport system component